jgi:hypothetical protein
MMWVPRFQGHYMQKVVVLVLLSLFAALAAAQAPANKNKTMVGKTAGKSKRSASEEATAAAQAAAIAQAAGLQSGMSVTAPLHAQAQPPVTAVGTASVAGQVTSKAAAPAALAKAQVAASHETVSAEELAIAKRVHQGHLACELGTSIRVEHDAAQPGYFNLQGKGFRYRMRPVLTSTGAIRLEDAKAGAVWLQLANKSMLMDQKKGQRVADECAHPEQLAYAESMKTNPPPKLFDTSGMGR